MYLLVPVVKYHEITEQEEGVILSLVDLSPSGVLSIDEIKEDKEEDVKAGVLVVYKNGGGSKELRIPFLDLLDLLNKNALVNFGVVQHCVKYSEELNDRVEEGKRIIEAQRYADQLKQPPYWKE